MAIIKVVNSGSGNSTHAAMRNCLSYVLKEGKQNNNGELRYVTGQYDRDEVTADQVYQEFKEQKKFWEKDSGRMYAHYVCSWHKEEKISPQQALEFGKTWAEKVFPRHQCLVAVHIDRDHIHCHMVINTVSYLDGYKLHVSAAELEEAKQICNQMCRERGLSVAEKNRHFDGSVIESGEIRSWDKNTYQLLMDSAKESYVAECGLAVMNAVQDSCSREIFIQKMEAQGWTVNWQEQRKNITFQDQQGHKVRDRRLSNLFRLQVSKEGLEHEFKRQAEERAEYDRYCRRIEEAVGGYPDSAADSPGREKHAGAGEQDLERKSRSVRTHR